MNDSTPTRRASRKAVVGIFAGVAAALFVASLSWACTPQAGQTWFSDGTFSKSGPTGSRITVYGFNARPNETFQLVIGNTVSHPNMGHYCMDNADVLNPTLRFSSSTGYIPLTSGSVTKGPGEWQICFRETDLGSATGAAIFTVL